MYKRRGSSTAAPSPQQCASSHSAEPDWKWVIFLKSEAFTGSRKVDKGRRGVSTRM